MLFQCLLAATERILLDLGGDLFGAVANKDRARFNGRRHLGARPLQSIQEPRVDQSRFGITQLRCHITGEAKVWVLVDCTGNQAGDLGCLGGVGPKQEGERGGEGRGRLDSGEVNLGPVSMTCGITRCRHLQRAYIYLSDASSRIKSEASIRRAPVNPLRRVSTRTLGT